MPRLADRLYQARRQRFSGRTEERALFAAALMASDLPFHILYVYGPGGIGKSTLLREYMSVCAQSSIPAYFLDAATIEPTSAAFLSALAQIFGEDPASDPISVLNETLQRRVLFIDTYDHLSGLDYWVRETLLPALPDDTLVVLADTTPPVVAWRIDPGWQTLVHTLPLRNFSSSESRAYLAMREVPHQQHQAILNFTHGHPLALALVADLFAQRRVVTFTPDEVPDIIHTLLEHLVQHVPGPAHRAALEVCALVRLTSESLLSDILMMPNVHELFSWLRGLSFIIAVQQGLMLHPLVREALATDVRWRNPDWYRELHRRIRHYYTRQIPQSSPQEQQQILMDYIFLHCHNTVVRINFAWPNDTPYISDGLRDQDHPALIGMVQQFEGPESASLSQHWLNAYPHATLVIRDQTGQPVGFLMQLGLQQIEATERQMDPATRAAWQHLEQHAPLRQGEQATLFRCWMAQDTYQDVSPVQTLIFTQMVRHYLITPGLAFTFLPCADPASWSALLQYADIARLASADFMVDGHSYGMYGHDWRTVPPTVWLDGLAAREVAPETPITPTPIIAPLIVLSHEDFVAAVRAALRDRGAVQSLRTNPLLHTRLVATKAGIHATDVVRIDHLQQLLQATCENLRATPNSMKFYRVLYHTYLQPAATQEQAAELLNIPFSTYRRHLKAGIQQIAEILWQQELGESTM
ncbi:MAG: ATP-binding protein [Chloroflexi bacterium AL-W]|nr:ATP-binding protein [Chloroflexi bacterium AL-N1]NOK65618.1 ATP-binding protein [Chloroflexi bacterium AL-N10]NOK74441.1 ATP-binding protein [Chloroflexi bacterium AL-N5]NOK80651.1 ATP-binding protein [Chloroflexi bacterium AL-W]NOK88699.1 ATP-binding protein [Chloroflexi bacterium AL-N15]